MVFPKVQTSTSIDIKVLADEMVKKLGLSTANAIMQVGTDSMTGKGWKTILFKDKFQFAPTIVAIANYREGNVKFPKYSLPKVQFGNIPPITIPPVDRIPNVPAVTIPALPSTALLPQLPNVADFSGVSIDAPAPIPSFGLPPINIPNLTIPAVSVPLIPREDYRIRLQNDFYTTAQSALGDWGWANWMRDLIASTNKAVGYVAGAGINVFYDIVIAPQISKVTETINSAISNVQTKVQGVITGTKNAIQDGVDGMRSQINNGIRETIQSVNGNIAKLIFKTNQSLKQAVDALNNIKNQLIGNTNQTLNNANQEINARMQQLSRISTDAVNQMNGSVNSAIGQTNVQVNNVQKYMIDQLNASMSNLVVNLNSYWDQISFAISNSMSESIMSMYKAIGLEPNMLMTPVQIRNIDGNGFEWYSLGNMTIQYIALIKKLY